MTPATGALEHTQRTWEALAQADPLWAVLSEPDKIGRRWAVDEFFESGEVQIASSLGRFEQLGGTLPDRELALDFGCGVGRLTQPLARRFDRVVGIDISPTMVEVARRLSPFGPSVEYVVNEAADLRFVPDHSVSLVNSHITLQHMPPDVAIEYLGEFLRIVKPSGAVIFQLPSHLSELYLPAEDQGALVPGEGHRARITAEIPRTLSVDETTPVPVTVRNTSDVEWLQTAQHPVLVGNHWRDADGRVVAWDDGRARLPVRLGPGETAEVFLTLRPPAQPGHYRLEIDVVQEGAAWFADLGSPTLESPVEVVPRIKPDYEGGSFGDLLQRTIHEAPAFEMHGVPIATVREIVAAYGARILGADEWVTEWHSFSYYVQAAG